MAPVRLSDRTDFVSIVEHWPNPPVPFHVALPARRMFEYDLRRYVRMAMGGRSYLIAGHRGAGKTSLVIDSVEAVRREVIGQSVGRQKSALNAGPFRRPLLVRLYGPSLLNPDFVEPGDAKKPNDPAEKETADVRQVLVQITLALYRALAQEVVSGYTAHAQANARAGKPGTDHAERAAKLALALDAGADPKVLRQMWQAIGRLQNGVLWPPDADATLSLQQMDGQGLREIVALVTAGQAFQVCSGSVTYAQKEHNGFEHEETAKSENRWATQAKTVRDTVDKSARLATVGLAAATGVGVHVASHSDSFPIWPLLSAGLVWLLGNWSLSFSSSTTRKSNDSLEYSFIRKPDASTLERDLPLVISRTREAGLTPVFLIDELDKVTGNGMAEIKTIMRRLKHLVADFGFFCFLVNRHCFGEIEREIRDRIYPEAHTLFSTRILLYPDPLATIRYIIAQIEIESNERNAERARLILSLNLAYQSQLNLNDLSREMAQSGEGDPGALGTPEDWLTEPRLILAAVQLAIMATLQGSSLQGRMRSDPTFAHRVFDTAYFIPRRWRQVYDQTNRAKGGDDGLADRDYLIDCSAEALRTYLLSREQPEIRDGTARSPRYLRGGESHESGEGRTIGDGDLESLHKCLKQVIGYLLAPASIPDTGAFGASAFGFQHWEGVIGSRLPIFRAAGHDQLRAEYTPEGDEIEFRLTPEISDNIVAAHLNIKAIRDLLAKCGTSFDDLYRLPLGISLNDARAQGLIAVFSRTDLDKVPEDELRDRYAEWLKFKQEFSRASRKVAALAMLLWQCPRVSGDSTWSSASLERISRLIPFDLDVEEWPGFQDGLLTPPDAGEPASTNAINTFKRRLGRTKRVDVEFDPTRSETLAADLRDWLDGGSDRIVTSLEDLYRATMPRSLLAIMRCDPAAMTNAEWSQLAIAALFERDSGQTRPLSIGVAALRALCVGRQYLWRLVGPGNEDGLSRIGWLDGTGGPDLELAREIVDAANDGLAASLLITEAPNAITQAPPSQGVKPVFILLGAGSARHTNSLAMLRNCGVIDAIGTV